MKKKTSTETKTCGKRTYCASLASRALPHPALPPAPVNLARSSTWTTQREELLIPCKTKGKGKWKNKRGKCLSWQQQPRKCLQLFFFISGKLARACRDRHKSVIRRSSCTRKHTQTYSTHTQAHVCTCTILWLLYNQANCRAICKICDSDKHREGER